MINISPRARFLLIPLSLMLMASFAHAAAQDSTNTSGVQSTPAAPVAGEAACNECKKNLIYKRWRLRLDCLDKGGDSKSCDGAIVGDTCCHCQKHPREEPDCWAVTCETECNWTQQCANVCG